MNNFDKDFKRTQRFISVTGIIIIVVSVVSLMACVVFFSKVAKDVSEKGLKAVVEQVWEGPSK